jgi:PKD repeat protein
MNPQNCMSQGDEVCDTPPTGGPMYGCPSGAFNSCQESPTDLNDQTVNYMDYTDDRCMVMFSKGQRDRMFFYLDTDRAQLWSASNLTATGCDGTLSPGCRPVADFEASPANVCVGNSIQFQDQTTGGATNWQWTFAGGNPATSTLQNPLVSWTQPGTYAVTLLASNAIGADTLQQNGFVTIAAPRSGPVIEGFEASTNLPLEWYAIDEDQSGTWQVSSVTGRSGQQSIFVPNFATPVQRMQDDLVTHVIDLSATSAPGELTFAHAYRRRDSFVKDSLQVWASTDCGATWQMLWEKWGNALATIGGYNAASPFVPTASQWDADTVNLQALAGAQQVRLMFRSVGGASQDLYLDDINLSLLTAAPSAQQPAQLKILAYPNPATLPPTLELRLGQATTLNAQLVDLAGRVAFSWEPQKMAAGTHFMEIPAMVWGKMPAGLYFLRINSPGFVGCVKIVKDRQ